MLMVIDAEDVIEPVGFVDPMIEPPDSVNTAPSVPVLSETAEPIPIAPEVTAPLEPVLTVGMAPVGVVIAGIEAADEDPMIVLLENV